MDERIEIFRSDEISDELWVQIAEGYKSCFSINPSPEHLKEIFANSIMGYTLHAVKLNSDNRLMGHNYFQPRPYIVNGKKEILALSGGTFVLPEFRKDIFIFHDLYKALVKEAKNLGWIAQLGVPNENSFEYSRKFLKNKYLGDLKYYLFPIHVARILKKQSKLIDLISETALRIWSLSMIPIASIFNTKERNSHLKLDLDSGYLNIRCKNNTYTHIKSGKCEGVYRMYDEDGIKTAYIIHFAQNGKKTFRSLVHVVRHILKNEAADAIMYVGTKLLPQILLIPVPDRFNPHRLTLCSDVFDKSDNNLVDVLSDIKKIDYSLINFDVR